MKFRHLVFLFIIAFGISGCSSSSQQTSDKPIVVATTSIIADVLTNICGESAEIQSIMGPGVDPHLYKASHKDIEKLTTADVIVYNGLHLEGKMSDVLERLAKKKTVLAFSDGVKPTDLRAINADADVYDPHIWFDPTIWKQGIMYLAEELGSKYPNLKEAIDKNTTDYIAALDSIDSLCMELAQSLEQDKRVIITSHDAFMYFGNHYGFEVKGLQGISTLSESGLKDVTNMVNYIIDRKVAAVFVENSVPQKALRSVIDGCNVKGHTVEIGGELFSDALGAERTPEGTYTGMLQYNMETVVKALAK